MGDIEHVAGKPIAMGHEATVDLTVGLVAMFLIWYDSPHNLVGPVHSMFVVHDPMLLCVLTLVFQVPVLFLLCTLPHNCMEFDIPLLQFA